MGNFGTRPNISSNGESFVVAWTAVLYAKVRLFNFRSQSSCFSCSTNWANIVLMVLLNLSVMPSAWGWYAVVRSVCTSKRSQRLSITWLVKLVPRSVNTASGIPKVKQKSTHFSATSSAVWPFMAYVFVNFVKWSHIASMKRLPLGVSGNGPAMSIVITINVLVGAKGINFGLQ